MEVVNGTNGLAETRWTKIGRSVEKQATGGWVLVGSFTNYNCLVYCFGG